MTERARDAITNSKYNCNMAMGGRREGAGRPALPKDKQRVTKVMRLLPDTAERLEQLKKQTGMSIGQLVDFAVKNME